MIDSFAVHLGGGVYLDARGKMVFEEPSRAQIYQLPGGFNVDLEKVREAFKDLSNILPRDDEGKRKWNGWGIPAETIDFLESVVDVSGIVTGAVAVYSWAIGRLVGLMGLLTKDDGLSPALGAALYSIKNQLQGLEQIALLNQMIEMRSKFNGPIYSVQGILTTLNIENPSGARRAAFFNEMHGVVRELAQPLDQLRNQAWAVTSDPDWYKGRAFAHYLLVFHRSDGSLAPVPMHSPGVTMFDYRLGVPMLLFGATAYTSVIQGAMPWFRSAGEYATHLRATADAIDRFVIRMQDESLARIHYGSMEQMLGEQIALVPQIPMSHRPVPTNPHLVPAVPAGAFDLVRYNDAFLSERYGESLQAGSLFGPRGLFTYYWVPSGSGLEEITAEANEQSRRDYAQLQTATGMFRLVHTAAWLRFLSTPPATSQTVSGTVNDGRVLVGEQPTTAKSPKIIFHGEIEHPATLSRFNASSAIRITTQLPGYRPAFRYRVVLRTLDCTFPKNAWINRQYIDDVWRVAYEPTVGDPRCNRLVTRFNQQLVAGEIVLAQEGPSPSAPVHVNRRRASIEATTFDWYVPVFSRWSQFVDPDALQFINPFATRSRSAVAILRPDVVASTGGMSLHMAGANAIMPLAGGRPSSLLPPFSPNVHDGMTMTVGDLALDKAERRHVKRERVEFDWELDWVDGVLEIRLFGLPDSRPFQFHIVVEEIVYSGEVVPAGIGDILSDASLRERIHTPFAGEMVNQLVFVSEEFFIRERKAIESANEVLSEFEDRFTESRPPGPLDPIVNLFQSVRESMTLSQSTATITSSLKNRAEFAEEYAEDLWESILERRGIDD